MSVFSCFSDLARRADRWRLQPWAASVGAAWADLLAVLLPTSCVVCETADCSLCPGCRRVVRRSGTRPYYAQDAAELLPGRENSADSAQGLEADEPAPLPVIAAGRYAGSLARVLLAYKNHGHTDLADVLRPMLAGALHQAAADVGGSMGGDNPKIVLVPVPATGRARRRRGCRPEQPWNLWSDSENGVHGTLCVPPPRLRLPAECEAKRHWDAAGAAEMFTGL